MNKKEKEKEKEFITFLGVPLDYDILRAWIVSPFTLDKRETIVFKKFVKDHGYEHSDFGWFFEVYWKRDCQLARSETEGLLKIVDEMEAFSKNDLNGLFGACKTELIKAQATTIFIAPRLRGSKVDKGCFTEFNHLTKHLREGLDKIAQLEKLIIQAFGNVPVEKIIEQKKEEEEE